MEKEVTIGGKKFIVKPNVFEPYYVAKDDILYNLPELSDCRKVLDMGTGTGVLAILWESQYPNLSEIWAVDINQNAVENAKENVKRHNAKKITILKSNLFEKIPSNMKFDAIIFNGPHVEEENFQDRERLGVLYHSLYDPGLRIADRFFKKSHNYLNPNGFIIYTFSDYGNLLELLRIIKERGWIATFISITNFKDRDVERIIKWTIPLWYNLKIYRVENVTLEEIFEGFRHVIRRLSDYYLEAYEKSGKKEILTEYIKKIFYILDGLMIQVEAWLDKLFSDKKAWIFAGFSYPLWKTKEIYWRYFYAFSSSLTTEYQRDFKKALEKFSKILSDKLEGEIEFIVEYLAKKEGLEEIEITLGKEFEVFKLGFPPYARLLARLEELSERYSLEKLLKAKEEDLKVIFKRKAEAFGNKFKSALYPLTDEEQKILKNAYINFYVLNSEDIRLQVMNFRSVKILSAVENSANYFFSSLPKDRFVNQLMSLLYEVFSIALTHIQEPIWEHIRYIYALRSAVAAIMARNMSHNIGSHVLNYLSNPEELDDLWII